MEELTSFLKVNRIENLKILINIKHMSEDFFLAGSISFCAFQQCVVTLEEVKTAVKNEFKRLYTESNQLTRERANLEIAQEDIESIPKMLELAEVITEEMILSLPKYPRKKGASLPTTGNEQSKYKKPNPFEILTSLKLKKESK